MSDQTNNTPQAVGNEAHASVNDKPLGENGEKALKAERTRASAAEKERDALKAQLDKIAQANETAVEKAQREAQEARDQIAKLPNLVADQLKSHLVSIHGISDEDSELFLTSSDPEVLLKQVTRLTDRSSTKDTQPAGPRPDLSQGGKGGEALALNSNGLEDALKNKLGIS
jgi:hypothetical protein